MDIRSQVARLRPSDTCLRMGCMALLIAGGMSLLLAGCGSAERYADASCVKLESAQRPDVMLGWLAAMRARRADPVGRALNVSLTEADGGIVFNELPNGWSLGKADGLLICETPHWKGRIECRTAERGGPVRRVWIPAHGGVAGFHVWSEGESFRKVSFGLTKQGADFSVVSYLLPPMSSMAWIVVSLNVQCSSDTSLRDAIAYVGSCEDVLNRVCAGLIDALQDKGEELERILIESRDE